MSYFFAIIGTKDSPVYELEFGASRNGGDGISRFSSEMKELNPFILHGALDLVEEIQWSVNSLYLKAVDTFYSYTVSALVTPGNIRLLLLHESKGQEHVKQFLSEVHELYVKTLLSPFYFVNQPITNPIFDQRVKASAKKYL